MSERLHGTRHGKKSALVEENQEIKGRRQLWLRHFNRISSHVRILCSSVTTLLACFFSCVKILYFVIDMRFFNGAASFLDYTALNYRGCWKECGRKRFHLSIKSQYSWTDWRITRDTLPIIVCFATEFRSEHLPYGAKLLMITFRCMCKTHTHTFQTSNKFHTMKIKKPKWCNN